MRGLVVLVTVLVSSAPTPADADVAKLFAEVHGGAMFGKGLSGDVVSSTVDAAFFEKAPHGAYGALIGAQFLVFDVEIQHHQFTNGDRLATWTQFGGGMRFEIGTGGQTKEEKAAGKGGYAEIGVGVFFGLGTGQQVMPPLSNDEVTDKAFLIQGKLGFGMRLNKILDIGIQLPVSWGYFFKTGDGLAANTVETHYQSVQGEALLVLRGNIRLF